MTVTTQQYLPFHRPFIEDDEIAAVVETLRNGWLTKGPLVEKFESAMAGYLGARHAITVSSCTAAMHLAFAAIGLEEGDEVIVPTMTFAASGEVILYFKARPVLVDCDPLTMQINADAIERAITRKTRAILPVHFAGFPCEMDRIMDIAAKHNLQVIEDAAHALPTSYRDSMVGTIGDLTCFSFYATKTLTTGEGGLVTTANDDFAERIRILSLHGISRDAWKRYSQEGNWRYDIIEPGFKYNLTDVQAALGLVQLSKCDLMRDSRARIARTYTEALSGHGAILPPPEPTNGQHAWHLYVIRVNESALRIGRDRVIEELKLRGVGTSVHFIPLHLHTLYQRDLGYRTGDFPVAESLFNCILSLPIYPQMTESEVGRVLGALRDVARQFKR